MSRSFALAAFFVSLPLSAQERNFKAELDPKRVDQAIDKGIVYLKRAGAESKPFYRYRNTDELTLLALLADGVTLSDPVFNALFTKMMSDPLDDVYKVSLQAMVLEEVDRVRFQERIYACAQFLVDSQCPDGLWPYGDAPVAPPPARPVRVDTATSGAAKPAVRDFAVKKREKPPVRQKIEVKRMREGGRGEGMPNNSTAQYAALGLRACHDAGIIIPRETIERGVKWWMDHQIPQRGEAPGATATGVGAGNKVAWGYVGPGPGGAQISMTAGGVGTLAIYDYMRGEDWKKNSVIRAGLNWLAEHFSVAENAGNGWGHPRAFLYYQLYALERTGVLCCTDTFGRHDWYREGAKLLLAEQKGDGSWDNDGTWLGGTGGTQPVWDTCFAILFLKRATSPLRDVASVDRPKR